MEKTTFIKLKRCFALIEKAQGNKQLVLKLIVKKLIREHEEPWFWEKMFSQKITLL
jgi:hypothetical protein